MRSIFILLFCVPFVLGNDFANKQIIKLESDNAQFIDLGQSKTISEDARAIFDSSKILKKNEAYLEYEDTDKDFILLVGFNRDLYFEFEDLNISGEEFVEDIFISFIEELSLNKNLQLLNRQNNDLYQDLRNFSLLNQNPKHRLFDVSRLLSHALSTDRIHNKKPDYVLFIALDECFTREEKTLFFTQKRAYINLEYKILKLANNSIIDHQILSFFFAIAKEQDKNQRYYASIKRAGVELRKYFSSLAKKLR